MANGRGGDDGNITRFPQYGSTRPKPFIEPLEAFSPGEWYGKPVPSYDWMVDGCLLRGTVGMLSGDGGIGKSLLGQQLLTAASLGQDWIGRKTKKARGFGFFCEDDKDELHRRQDNINRHYDCDYPDLEVSYVSRVGMENVLAEFDRRTDRVIATPLWDQVQNEILSIGAQFILIDTIADAYGGQENIRVQVRRFITELRRLAIRMQGFVLITAHPSLTGMTTGSGLSGSTAWHNSVRSRMYLTRPRKPGREEEEDDSDINARVLKTMKNNQGPGSGAINLHWERGVFRLDDVQTSGYGVVDKLIIDRAVLDAAMLIVKQGNRIASGTQHQRCLAAQMLMMPAYRRYKRGDIINAQDRLLQDKRLISVTLGPPSRRYSLIRPADWQYPDEDVTP